jgi:hypothetical protein
VRCASEQSDLGRSHDGVAAREGAPARGLKVATQGTPHSFQQILREGPPAPSGVSTQGARTQIGRRFASSCTWRSSSATRVQEPIRLRPRMRTMEQDRYCRDRFPSSGEIRLEQLQKAGEARVAVGGSNSPTTMS